ncbi:hypothetical protein KZX46_18535 [Polymorphobacter sp. PAMC 29334]|uniref:hypothetical protein n=1 Tax=Polymorphobacter sp. PAMC 29334 TaxID=2862331 RepID=UPI001C77E55B|nr:hypothetical protein [Polymorphobacter sp. PAMC 29334]QYE34724.1 hypothetical protein KZX46_18535 [Polymorphobacter sp. PAMC 29334]
MIPITPEIMGPGIEEEYADALSAVHDMQRALGPQPLTNHTPEGRVSMEIKWVEQEIATRRLPIPVDKSYVHTIYYLVGSNELANYPGFQPAIVRLARVLDGDGLIKPRHLPIVVAMIEEFLDDAAKIRSNLPESDRLILADLNTIAHELQRGVMPAARRPQDTFSALASDALEQGVPNGSNRLRSINMSLFGGRRPWPARKPPLPAPVAGLPERAPPLPPALEGKMP